MKNSDEISIKGVISLQTTPGRKDTWVKKQVEHDYFLSLHITKINDVDISTTKDAFNALASKFPSITVQEKSLTELFTSVSLPPNAADILHVTLGNFPDFRVDRNVANDIDPQMVERAAKLAGQEVSLSLSADDFELVATSEQIKAVRMSAGTTEQARAVGFKRDAVLNLKPSDSTQQQLAAYAKQVFGSDYQLWNGQQQPVAYHITIAQTDKLSEAILSSMSLNPQHGNPIFSGANAETVSKQVVRDEGDQTSAVKSELK